MAKLDGANEIEIRFLSRLIIEENGIQITKVTPEMFFVDTNRIVFEYCKDYYVKHLNAPSKENVHRNCGTMLFDCNEDFTYLEKEVIEAYFHFKMRERLIHQGNLLNNKQYDKLVTSVENTPALVRSVYPSELEEATDLFDENLNKELMKEYLDRKAGRTGIVTPWPSINDMTLGWHGGDFIVIGARPATGKCIDADTKMYDAQTGDLIPVKDLMAKKRSTLYWRKNKGISPYAPDAFIYTGKKETKKIILDNGLEIIVTPEHPFLSANGPVKVLDNTLCEGVLIASASKIPFPTDTEEVTEVSLKISALKIASKSKDVEVPHYVFRLSGNQLQIWLDTFMSACSNFIGPHSFYFFLKNKELLLQIRHLLLRFGIYAHVHEFDDTFRLIAYGKYADKLFKIIKLGNLDFEQGTSPSEFTDIEWARVLKIEDSGVRDVYDLTIDDGHWFVANDIVVHNTYFLLQMASHAIKQNKKILFVSPEMGRNALVRRFASLELKIPLKGIRSGQLTTEQERRFFDFVQNKSRTDKFQIFSDNFVCSIQVIRTAIEKHKPDIVFIDGLYLIRVPNVMTKNSSETASVVANSIKMMAKEYGIPFVCSMQFNREANKVKTEEVSLSNLALSDVIGWNADAAFALGKDSHNVLSIKTLKIREGEMPSENITLNWNFELFDFSEITKVDQNQRMPF